MKIMKKVLHSRRPLVIGHTEGLMARNFEKVMKLKKGACTVKITEHPELKPCPTDEFPHCHYDVVVKADISKTLPPEIALADKNEPHCLRCGVPNKKPVGPCSVYGKPYKTHMWKAPKKKI